MNMIGWTTCKTSCHWLALILSLLTLVQDPSELPILQPYLPLQGTAIIMYCVLRSEIFFHNFSLQSPVLCNLIARKIPIWPFLKFCIFVPSMSHPHKNWAIGSLIFSKLLFSVVPALAKTNISDQWEYKKTCKYKIYVHKIYCKIHRSILL